VNGDDPDAPHSTFSQSSKEVREHINAYRWIWDNPADTLCVNISTVKLTSYWNAVFQVIEINFF
jgi:hypothetical protein